MERFFLFVNIKIDQPYDGAAKKMRAEINTLRRFGYEVFYTAYESDGVAIYDNNDNVLCSQKYGIKISKYNNLRKSTMIKQLSVRFLEKSSFDYALLRIHVIDQYYEKMLRILKRNNTFVMMESLSYFPELKYDDLKSLSYKYKWFRIKSKANVLKRTVDLMLTEGNIGDFWGIPCIEFGMGVNVSDYPVHKYIGNDDELNLIMVGCTSIYHGTDRIIKSLNMHYQDNSSLIVNLHLVGDVLKKDIDMIRSYGVGEHVILHGKLYGQALFDVYNLCNVALGPLAQYRVEKKDTGLKTKEYMAIGIPYVYSGNEVTVPSSYPFIMNVDNDDSVINFDRIYSFIKKIQCDSGVADKMRNDAKKWFSWDCIFMKVIEVATQMKKRGAGKLK